MTFTATLLQPYDVLVLSLTRTVVLSFEKLLSIVKLFRPLPFSWMRNITRMEKQTENFCLVQTGKRDQIKMKIGSQNPGYTIMAS